MKRKKITLKRLELKNWKSLNLDVTFNNEKNIVKGRNGVGKSSLQSAWNWLLSGYTNAIAPKNHELFDNRYELTHETPVASVKATVLIDDLEYTLEKTAQAKFIRKRGTNEYLKDSSDTYKTLIDEIEISATDFNSWIEHNICPTDMLVYCLDGSFFTALADDDKRKARGVLETIIEEIKDTDYKGDYAVLENDLKKGYTIEQIEERTKNLMKPLKERMAKIPTLIEDKENSVAEYLAMNFDAIENELNNKRKSLLSIDDALLGKSNELKSVIDKRNEILNLINSKTLELSKGRIAYTEKKNASTSELKAKISEIESDNALIRMRNAKRKREYDESVAEIEKTKKSLSSANEYLELLRKRKDDLKSLQFNRDTCAVCGQELPYDMLETAKAKFNDQKEKDLAYIIEQGKATKQRVEQLQCELNRLQAVIDAGVKFEVENSVDYLIKEIDRIVEKFSSYEETDEYKAMNHEIEKLERSLPEIPPQDNDALTNTKKMLLDAIESLNRDLGLKYKADELKSEIDALKCELRNIANDVALLELKLDKCKERIEERANIISNRINEKLVNSKIQMWQMQKNGELTPSCTITDNSGVKFSTLNNSNRIKTAIEMQQLFCTHYNIDMPVFIDEYAIFDSRNAPKLSCQHICLHASDDEKLIFG